VSRKKKIIPDKHRNLTSSSYEKYMKDQLALLSPNLVIKEYKLAPKEDYPTFERGKDMRIQIRWKKNILLEFIIEKSFWLQSNRTKEDRLWMRDFAHSKLDPLKVLYFKAQEKSKKKKSKTKIKIGSTQKLFDKMKTNG
tara:strand:- start:197 stop:613 length:417 start_codon:yes stop_codon:yes gene_type:complete